MWQESDSAGRIPFANNNIRMFNTYDNCTVLA